MKKLFILLILCLFSSCEESRYCTDVIKGKPENNLISDSDMNIVRSLFSANNLSIENFLVYRLQKDESGNYHVRCFQYVNNLNVFTDDVIFHFDSQNHYYFLSGETISEIDIRTSPKMSKNDIIEMFLKSVENDSFFNGSLQQIKDGCFYCELGYYDLNAGISYSTHNFKLAWRIHPEDSDYPVATINDTDGDLIGYFNGIIIN
jgi:hypothetical protein